MTRKALLAVGAALLAVSIANAQDSPLICRLKPAVQNPHKVICCGSDAVLVFGDGHQAEGLLYKNGKTLHLPIPNDPFNLWAAAGPGMALGATTKSICLVDIYHQKVNRWPIKLPSWTDEVDYLKAIAFAKGSAWLIGDSAIYGFQPSQKKPFTETDLKETILNDGHQAITAVDTRGGRIAFMTWNEVMATPEQLTGVIYAIEPKLSQIAKFKPKQNVASLAFLSDGRLGAMTTPSQDAWPLTSRRVEVFGSQGQTLSKSNLDDGDAMCSADCAIGCTDNTVSRYDLSGHVLGRWHGPADDVLQGTTFAAGIDKSHEVNILDLSLVKQNAPPPPELSIMRDGIDYSPNAGKLNLEGAKSFLLYPRTSAGKRRWPAALVKLPAGWTLKWKRTNDSTEIYRVTAPSGNAFQVVYATFAIDYTPAQWQEVKSHYLSDPNRFVVEDKLAEWNYYLGDKLTDWAITWRGNWPTYALTGLNAHRTLWFFVSSEKPGAAALPEARSLATALFTSFKVVEP